MRSLYFGLALAAAPLAHVHAQTPSTAAGGAAGELATVNVDASRTDGFVPSTVEAGTFRGTNLMDVPATVNTVTREVIELQGAAGVYDVLRNTAGVTRQQNGGDTFDQLVIRGIAVENRTNYRLNGSLAIPVARADDQLPLRDLNQGVIPTPPSTLPACAT